MRFEPALTHGVLLKRYKRFLADVRLDNGDVIVAHCPNPGRMTGCDASGSSVMLSHSDAAHRKLPWTWEMVQYQGTWISINTTRANAIVFEALTEGSIVELTGFDSIEKEVRWGPKHRFDFALNFGERRHLVEVKSVSLSSGPLALFPDSVTRRGREHLSTLMQALDEGFLATVIFLIARGDCDTFGPAHAIDPAFAAKLCQAHRAGVQILCYRAVVSPEEIRTEARIPHDLLACEMDQNARLGSS